MLVATLHCSDPACDAEVELEIEDLRELDGWSCDCGYGLVLLSVTESIPSEAISTSRARPRPRTRPGAAESGPYGVGIPSVRV